MLCSFFNGIDKKQHNNPTLFDGSVHPSGGEPAKAEEDAEEPEPPIDMSFPTDSAAKLVIYLLSFPLMAPLYITLPDMKNNDYTFFPSFKVPGILHSILTLFFEWNGSFKIYIYIYIYQNVVIVMEKCISGNIGKKGIACFTIIRQKTSNKNTSNINYLFPRESSHMGSINVIWCNSVIV